MIQQMIAVEQNQSRDFRSLPFEDLHGSLRFVMNLVELIARCFSLSLEVFLRRDFGERYLTGLAYLPPCLLFFFGSLASSFAAQQPVGSSSVVARASQSAAQNVGLGLTLLFAFVVLILLFTHKVWVWLRSAKGLRWHSYSQGVPWLPVRLVPKLVRRILVEVARGLAPATKQRHAWVTGVPDRIVEEYVQRAVEPLLCLVGGFLLMRMEWTATIGLYLSFCSGQLWLKNSLHHARQRKEFLDLIDADIEVGNMGAVLRGEKSAEAAEGLQLRGVPAHPAIREGLARALERKRLPAEASPVSSALGTDRGLDGSATENVGGDWESREEVGMEQREKPLFGGVRHLLERGTRDL